MRKIVRKPFVEQNDEEKFYFRMHLQIKIPFFERYDHLTMFNICKQLRQRVYDRGEVIAAKGDIADNMIVVLIGELGVYEDGKRLTHRLTENMSYGERALRIREPWKTTLVAQRVTVCLSLSRDDFQEQVFHLEH